MSIHEGHRQRLKQRFADHGERVFDDHQLLELMLFYAVPQGDVNPLAHRLINHFGSFAAVLDASRRICDRSKGVGEHRPLSLLFPQVMRRYLASRTGHEDKVCSVEDAGEYLLPYFFGAKSELLYLLCLDARVGCCPAVGWRRQSEPGAYGHPAGHRDRHGRPSHLRRAGPQPRQRPGRPFPKPT